MQKPLSHSNELSTIRSAVRHAEVRMRLARTVQAFSSWAIFGLMVASCVLLASKLGLLPQAATRPCLLALAFAVGLGTLASALRPLPPLAGALALDRHHALASRIANALSFASLSRSERSPLMELAIDDARRLGEDLRPTRAVPIRWPKRIAWIAVLAGAAALVHFFHLPAKAPLPVAAILDPVRLSADDLDLLRARVQEVTSKDPEVTAATAELNRLIEDISRERLDRTEAFRKMQELEARLLAGRAMSASELREELSERATALRKSDASRPAAEALAQADLSQAEKRLRDLSSQLRRSPQALDKEALAGLRDAMKKAAEGRAERLAQLERRREELAQDLLKKKSSNDAGAEDQEQSLLRKKQRELERLTREREQQATQGRQLDRLDRELAQAAEDLMRDLGLSADDLDRGAEDLHRMAEERLSDEQREELRQQLEDLREQIRQGGKDQIQKMKRFAKRARGEKQGNDAPCPPGDADCAQRKAQKKAQGDEGGEGDEEQGDPGKEVSLGGKRTVLSLQRSSGTGPGNSSSPGSQGADPAGTGGEKAAGSAHDPNMVGKRTDPAHMATEDVQAAGVDTGQGATRSEVILGAAEKGFRGGAYHRVYTEYRTTAEEQLHRENVPPGMNDHVRRYFDLIRPRQ